MKKSLCFKIADELGLRLREEPKCVNVLTSSGLVVYHASNRLFYRGVCKNEDNFETVWEEIYAWLSTAKKLSDPMGYREIPEFYLIETQEQENEDETQNDFKAVSRLPKPKIIKYSLNEQKGQFGANK